MKDKSGLIESDFEIRQRIEKIIQDKQDISEKYIQAMSSQETCQMIHELQMHQTELELKNQELRLALEQMKAKLPGNDQLFDIHGSAVDDVSESGKNRKILKKSEDKFRLLFIAMNDGACLHELVYDETGSPVDYRILEVNPRFEEITGLEARTIAGGLASQVYGTGAPPFMDIYSDVALTGSERVFETYFKPMEKYFRISVYSPSKGEFVTVFQDVTSSKQTEDQLRRNEAFLKKSQEIAKIGSWELDVATFNLVWSDEVYRIFGVDPDSFQNSYQAFLERVHPEDRELVNSAYLDSLREGRDGYEVEHRVVRNDTKKVRHVFEKCIHYRDATGRVFRSLGVVHDITDRIKVHEALKASLQEKEILLREVHHRVKNNLAIISALLEMQGDEVKDSPTRAVLTDLETRIRSIALVHEHLYKNNNLARIDFHDYLDALVQYLCISIAAGKNIRCSVQAHGISMGIDLAIPCGMIINELATNAIKYAFPEGRTYDGKDSPWISVEVQKNDGHYRIIVADNGVGFPEALNLNNSPSFGLRLVRMIGTHQLGGKFELERSPGARITLTFKARNKECA